MPAGCLLPAGISLASADPRGTGGSAGLIVPGCFQVWLCLFVMSACLTGTRPSSSVRDGMGALKQAGAGLRAGGEAVTARSGGGRGLGGKWTFSSPGVS